MQRYNLHTHKFTNNPAVLELVNQYPWDFDAAIPFYSIGIHPWYINEERLANDLETIAEKLQLKECLAVGECGLDKRIEIPMAMQIAVFEKQIALAERFKKPLVLHLVAAFDELIEIKNRLKITVPIVIHGFSKNEQIAKQLVSNGFYLSFGKYLLQSRKLGTDMEAVFKAVPNNRFFIETDTIEQTLAEVYELAAECKGMTLDEMQVQVKANWVAVFGD